ncbi:MAG: hypothetical protein CMI54_02275 [Parcubacteria group bacterium]|nr:hypothetical protein [Parcubacteria group bacterium]|tara:strand:+ start:587 stop:1195 length:609 start_codon:yes stop_codon:yes gene_type:complete
MLKLTRKTWAVFGYKGGGKSVLAQYIASSYGDKCLYYDTLHEAPPDASFHAFQPKNRQNVGELLSVIKLIQANKRYRMLIIDEANRYAKPKPTPLPQEIADMNDWARHPQYNLSVGYIARRPTQLNTDLTEIADYLFIFHLGGKNDIKYLNDLRSGLGDTVQNLPLWHFVVADQSRHWQIMAPVDIHKIRKSRGQASIVPMT